MTRRCGRRTASQGLQLDAGLSKDTSVVDTNRTNWAGLARSGNKEDRKLLAEGQADAIDPKRAFDSVLFQQHFSDATDKPMTSAHWSKADTLVAFVGRLMGNNACWRRFGFFMEPN